MGMDDEFSERTGPSSHSVRNKQRKDKNQKTKRKEGFKIRMFKIFYQITKDRSIVYSIKQPNAYWFFMFLFLALILLYYLALVILDFGIKKRRVVSFLAINYLSSISIIYFWVLVIPTTDFFISIYECDSNTNKLIMDSSFTCWDGLHAFYCGLFTLGLILFFCILILISFLNNESRPYHTDSLKRLDNNEELFLAIYRMILTITSHYTSSSSFQWLVLAFHILMSAHLVKNYSKYLHYYDAQISTMYGACCLGYFWVAANSLLVKALETTNYKGQIIVVMLGILFAYPTAYFLRKNKLEKLVMYKQQEKIKNDLELDQFITNFQNFITESEQDEQREMMLLGLLFMHKEECQSSICPLKNTDELYLPLTDQNSQRVLFPSKDKILHQHLVNSVFLDFSRTHQNVLTAVMHTSYAFFLFYQMGNIHMALIELNLASKCRTSTQQSFTIFKCKQLIEEHLVKKFKTSKNTNQTNISYADLDVTIVITFEGLFNRFEKAIEQSATDHIEFWSHLDSNMIDLNVINKLGLNIINQTKKVNEIWSILKRINPNYPNALYIYGNYLSQIKNDYEQGEDYKNQYMLVKRQKQIDDLENHFEIMFADDTTVIVMSGNKEQQGKIIKTNQGIFKLFGYSMFEVQGHDVNVLMPPVIALKHNFFLEKFIRTGRERILNNCLESFAMYRTGIIFPIQLIVKPVPSLRNDIQYIGMIKRSEKDFEYILTDDNGKIDSISDGIISLFKLPISFFKEHDIPIQVIVPELCEVSKQKGSTGESITNFEAWNGLKDLRFYIPKNLSNSANRAGMVSTNNKQGDAATDDAISGSGATGTGTGTGTQTSSSSKAKNMQLLTAAGGGQVFTGLRNPESLKAISNMFKNAEHKGQPDKYKNNLLNHVNYNNPDFDKNLKTEMITSSYSDGDLRVKVFKIYFNKKKKNQFNKNNQLQQIDSTQSSIMGNKDEDTLLHKFGMTGMSALNDKYAFQKYRELIAESKNLDKNFNFKRFQNDIDVLKILLERQRKIRTYGNIMTPQEYEEAELDRMIQNITFLEAQINEMNSENSKANQGTDKNSSGHLNKGKNQSFMSHFKPIDVVNLDQDDTSNTSQLQNIKNPNLQILQPDNPSDQHKRDHGISFNANETPGGFVSNQDQDDNQNADFDESHMQSNSKQGNKYNSNNKNDGAKVPLLTNTEGQEDTDEYQNNLKANAQVKKKENPRLEYVNDFFQQNLMVSDNDNSTSQNYLMPQQRNNKHSRRQEQFKQAYQVDLQNEILRNLHVTHKEKGSHFRKDEYTSHMNQSQMMESSSAFPLSAEQMKEKKEGVPIVNNNTNDEQIQIKDTSSLKLINDTGSVTSDTKTLMRHLRVLRYALYENYSPQSVQNLKYSARFVLIVLLSMTIASFVLSKQKYSLLQNNFHMIQSSEERMQSITTINSDTRACVLIQQGVMNRYRYSSTQDYLLQMQNDLDEQAQKLQAAQHNLSWSYSNSNVTLFFDTLQAMGNNQTVNIWASAMQIAVNAYRIKNFQMGSFTNTSLPIWFILKNSMNNILESISTTTSEILSDTQMLSDTNKKLLLILLIVASGCLSISMIIIMPVVTKVHKDKDKLLSLFLQIDHNDVKDQLKKCKDFFSTFHNDDKNAQNNDQGFEFDDDDKKEGEEDENIKKDGKTPSSDEQVKPGEQKNEGSAKRYSRKGKKHKKYSTNYFMLLLKFLVVIALLESYFLYQYFQSDKFLQSTLSMIKEASSIADRRFSNFLLYQIFIEILGTNGTSNVLNQNSFSYIQTYIGQFNLDLEKFLTIHSNNTGIHDEAFNGFFNQLIYQSVCKTIPSEFTADEQSKCNLYLGGILDKGLYSANLAYWDNIRQMMDSYTQSNKSQSFLSQMINSESMVQIEQLNLIYFSTAYNILMQKLNTSILISFENRSRELTILFSIYIIVLIIMFFILWGRFVESMRHSLWVTKSMLAIIPLEVIEKVKAIKDFLMTISRAAMSSMKD